MKKMITMILLFAALAFVSSCGEKIDECVGAAQDPLRPNISDDASCESCCQSNGYRTYTVETTTRNNERYHACKCRDKIED